MPEPARVLVLGGGFAAATACSAMRRAIRRGELEATVVTRTAYSCLHGLIAEMVTGRISPSAVASPARRVFAPAGVHVGEIEAIDLDAHRVLTSRSIDGARRELEYDHAVLALGVVEDLDAYPGLREHAFKLKNLDDVLRLRNHVVEMLELADGERDPDERRRLLTFVVAGGGYSGTELAGELADYLALLTATEYPGIATGDVRVVLVHPGPTILPELYGSGSLERDVKSFPQLVAFGMRHLRRLRVELMLETRVTGATATDVYLSNGESVPTRTIVSTVGMRANPLAERLEVERDDFGRILTEADLSVPGREGVWAVGDCAAVPHPDGGTCPPVALYAGHQGTRVGRNVVRSVQGRRPKPYRKAVRMQGVSIGGRAAVGEIRGVGLKGRLPWLMWRFVLRRVIPTRDRRVRVAVDWLLTPFLGRDIVQLGPSERDDYDVRHTVFQPGEPLAARDRPLRFVHILVEGEAEVVRAGEPVALLGPGDHCGRKWLELHDADAVRARTLVRTVTLRSDEANRLQDVLLSTERLVADTRSHTVLDRSKLEAG